MQHHISGSPVRKPDQRWKILAVVASAVFIVNLDVTIVNIALPNIIDDFYTSFAAGEWVLNAYILVFAVLLIPMGRLGDVIGRKKLFISGISVFTVASALCGLAPDVGWLIGARALQAAGGAAMMPATLSILNVTFQENQRGLAMGIWGAAAGTAAAIGPILGGLLVGAFGWPSIFLVNLPVGAAAVYAGLKVVPESQEPNASRKLDLRGILAISAALGTLTFALVEGQGLGWTSPIIIGLFCASAVTFIIFIHTESRSPAPLVNLSLFRSRSFSAGNALGLLVMFCLVGVVFLIVMYLQVVRQFSPLVTGLMILPLPLALAAVSAFAGKLADRVPMRWIMAGALALVSGSFLILSRITLDTAWPLVALPLAAAGLGLGMVMAPLGAVVMASAPVEKSGSASGVLTSLRQTGAVLGVSVLGAIMQFKLVANLRAFFELIPFMPQAAKESILEGVSRGGMNGAFSGNAPSFVQDLIAQVMREQFVGALSTALQGAAVAAALGALTALFIEYHPRASGFKPTAVQFIERVE
ncbi:MFS transporter [Dehalogenimonas alkenigignens]|uniref:MFS transporter n=1 Tax=Dehalogenimonas alkenigignens TaxID=1217799 RepID=UPI0014024583|nr:MFS transporter [Dehalogenimonas alkenigignens]